LVAGESQMLKQLAVRIAHSASWHTYGVVDGPGRRPAARSPRLFLDGGYGGHRGPPGRT